MSMWEEGIEEACALLWGSRAVPMRFNNEFGVNVSWDPNK